MAVPSSRAYKALISHEDVTWAGQKRVCLVVKMLLSPRKTADKTMTPTTFTMPV